jgi:hypothetical protein
MSSHPSPAAREPGPRELAIVHAASRILAAQIANGRLTDGNRAALIRSAVQLARQIAREAEAGSDVGEILGEPLEPDVLDLLD